MSSSHRHETRRWALLACVVVAVAGRMALGADGVRRDLPSTRLAVPPKPNIILILADDLGYGEVGCYGQARIKTPNIDRLATEGMRFTQCYAGTTVCAPSRAALMTGWHTGHVSLRGNAAVPLKTNELTVAQVLKRAGYATACFGKWGLGLLNTPSTPSKKGFDEWLGYLSQTHAHEYYPTQLWSSSARDQAEDRPVSLSNNLHGAQGDYAQALAFYEQSLRNHQVSRDKHEMASVLFFRLFRGEALLRQGDYAGAQAFFVDNIAPMQELELKNYLSYVMRRLGQALLHQDDYSGARVRFEESLVANLEIGDMKAVAACLAAFAALAQAQKELPRATQLFGASEAVSESIYTEMTPYDHDQYTRNVTALHTQLPAADFDAAWEAGRKLTLEEAVKLAMESVAQPVKNRR